MRNTPMCFVPSFLLTLIRYYQRVGLISLNIWNYRNLLRAAGCIPVKQSPVCNLY